MKILSWFIVIIMSIVGIGVGLYFLPMTRDMVINIIKDIPIVSNYIQPKEEKVDQVTLLKNSIGELKSQIDKGSSNFRVGDTLGIPPCVSI